MLISNSIKFSFLQGNYFKFEMATIWCHKQWQQIASPLPKGYGSKFITLVKRIVTIVPLILLTIAALFVRGVDRLLFPKKGELSPSTTQSSVSKSIATKTAKCSNEMHELDLKEINLNPNLDLCTTLQQTAKQMRVPFNCLNPAELINKNKIDQKVVDAYLATLHDKPKIFDLKKKMFDKITKITFQQLQIAIKVCCNQLNQLIGNEPYSLIFLQYKSQAWVAEQAAKYLTQAPTGFVWTDRLCPGNITDHFNGNNNSTLVIFDDMILSGLQLFSILSTLDLHAKQKLKIFVVAPFITEHSKKFLREKDAIPNLEIVTITTNLKINTLETVFNEEELGQIADDFSSENQPCFVSREELISRLAKKVLGFAEWKVPDNTSMWQGIKNVNIDGKSHSVFTDFDPPYWKEASNLS